MGLVNPLILLLHAAIRAGATTLIRSTSSVDDARIGAALSSTEGTLWSSCSVVSSEGHGVEGNNIWVRCNVRKWRRRTNTVQFRSICQSRVTGPSDETKFGVCHRSLGCLMKGSLVTPTQIWQFWLLSGLVWRNFAVVTACQPGWRNENFVRRVTVTCRWRIDRNCTVSE
jgi:hypothetical protein